MRVPTDPNFMKASPKFKSLFSRQQSTSSLSSNQGEMANLSTPDAGGTYPNHLLPRRSPSYERDCHPLHLPHGKTLIKRSCWKKMKQPMMISLLGDS